MLFKPLLSTVFQVILAAGGINSAQLLMLSGIGNGDDLKELGIPVSLHLPGVGYNLQDHLEVYVQHVSLKFYRGYFRNIKARIIYR